MPKLCLYLIAISLVLFSKQVNARQGDLELNRDSVVGWRYVINPPNPNAFYKPIKGQYANSDYYSVWQQQATDMLINWILQSYLPRGLVMSTIAKNDDRWHVDAIIGSGANDSVSVTNCGTKAGVSAGTNVRDAGGEANILSGKLSAQSGLSVEGAIPDALKILDP